MKNINFCHLLIAISAIFIIQQRSIAQYAIFKSVISNSGSSLTNTSFKIQGTLGQPLTGMAADNSYKLNHGFWDSNNSCNVPVELSCFSFYLSENIVILTWETASETNNFGFEIERKSNSGFWEKIGFIQGNGTTNVFKKYFFTDHSKLEPGNYFYRLKQIDTDGTFEYSSEIKVLLDLPKEYKLSNNYPNPFNPETIINYQLPKSVHVEIKIYNTLGQEIRTLLNEKRNAGYHQVIWDGKDNSGKTVSTGTYLYQMKTNDFVEVKKMTFIQ
jgi:hypothetical protein